MTAEHGPAWFDAGLLDPAQRRAANAYLRLRRPIGMVGQGERNDAFLASLTVRAAETFVVEGVAPWGLLETAEHGAVVVPAEITLGARLPKPPLALRRLGARVGPTVRRMEAAQGAVEERPAVRRLRDRFVAAAVAHSTLHRQLEAWKPEAPAD